MLLGCGADTSDADAAADEAHAAAMLPVNVAAALGLPLAPNHCAALSFNGQVDVKFKVAPTPELLSDQPQQLQLSLNGEKLLVGSEVPVRVELHCTCPQSVRLLGDAKLTFTGERCAPAQLAAYGKSSLRWGDWTGGALELRASGFARVAAPVVDAEQVRVLAAGNGEVSVQGRSDAIFADVAGAAKISIATLQVQSAEVVATGRAQVTLNATAHVAVELAKASDVQVSNVGPAPVQFEP